MYFIHIKTLADGENFTSWLDGQNRIALNDSTEFKEWLSGRHIFPLELYINGMIFSFKTKENLQFFTLGVEVILDLLMTNG